MTCARGAATARPSAVQLAGPGHISAAQEWSTVSSRGRHPPACRRPDSPALAVRPGTRCGPTNSARLSRPTPTVITRCARRLSPVGLADQRTHPACRNGAGRHRVYQARPPRAGRLGQPLSATSRRPAVRRRPVVHRVALRCRPARTRSGPVPPQSSTSSATWRGPAGRPAPGCAPWTPRRRPTAARSSRPATGVVPAQRHGGPRCGRAPGRWSLTPG